MLQAADGEEDAFVRLEPTCPDWQRYASANSGPFVPGENAICFEAYTTAGIGNLLTDLMGLLRLVWTMSARLLIGTADHKGLRAMLAPNQVQWSGVSCAPRDAPRHPRATTWTFESGWISLNADGRAALQAFDISGSIAWLRNTSHASLGAVVKIDPHARVHLLPGQLAYHGTVQLRDHITCAFNAFFRRTPRAVALVRQQRLAWSSSSGAKRADGSASYAAAHIRTAFSERTDRVAAMPVVLHPDPPQILCEAYLDAIRVCTNSEAPVFIASNSPTVERACGRQGASGLSGDLSIFGPRHTDKGTPGANFDMASAYSDGGLRIAELAFVTYFLYMDADIVVNGPGSTFSGSANVLSRKSYCAHWKLRSVGHAAHLLYSEASICTSSPIQHADCTNRTSKAQQKRAVSTPSAVAAARGNGAWSRSSRPLPKLKHDWSRLHLSPQAKAVRASQKVGSGDCDLRTVAFYELAHSGFGSDLHQWASALCWAVERNLTLVSVPRGTVNCKSQDESGSAGGVCSLTAVSDARWNWDDQSMCSEAELSAPLTCYWGQTANRCSRAALLAATRSRPIWAPMARLACDPASGCQPRHPCGTGFEAPLAHLFAGITRKVVEKVQAAALATFGAEGAPAELIAVHIRWGDKGVEKLVPIGAYVDAVVQLLERNGLSRTHAHVFVTTEDYSAVAAFQDAIAVRFPLWETYTHLQAIGQDSRHEKPISSPVAAAATTKGAAGTQSLIALLMALEARYCVLTSDSSWGRLIEALHTMLWAQHTSQTESSASRSSNTIRLDSRLAPHCESGARGIDACRADGVDRTRNGHCEDGGEGSVSAKCELGTDYTDCFQVMRCLGSPAAKQPAARGSRSTHGPHGHAQQAL